MRPGRVGGRLLLVLALASGPALATDAAPPLPACEAYALDADPFNAAGDRALRTAELARREADAASLSEVQLFGLGALYRLGREHPAALVDQDLGKARYYLGEAALAGHIEAYASMAELELAAGQPMEAMVWAQVYTKAMRVRDKGRGLGYPANLLRRIGSPGSAARQDARLAAFMQAQGQAHRARQALAAQAPAKPACRAAEDDFPVTLVTDLSALSNPQGMGLPMDDARSGYALFHLVVDPGGRITAVNVIESLPTAAAAVPLERIARAMTFNAVPASAPDRQALAPISLDDGTARLRN